MCVRTRPIPPARDLGRRRQIGPGEAAISRPERRREPSRKPSQTDEGYALSRIGGERARHRQGRWQDLHQGGERPGDMGHGIVDGAERDDDSTEAVERQGRGRGGLDRRGGDQGASVKADA